jgi:hypothetical protein
MAPPRRVCDQMLERALGMGEGLRRAAELHLPANVVPALQAELTALARLAHLEGHAITNLQRGDAGSDGSDNPGRFVAQSDRLPHQNVSVAVVVEVMQV